MWRIQGPRVQEVTSSSNNGEATHQRGQNCPVVPAYAHVRTYATEVDPHSDEEGREYEKDDAGNDDIVDGMALARRAAIHCAGDVCFQ